MLRVLERSGMITSAQERAHDTYRVIAANGISLPELAPPTDCRRVIMRGFCLPGQLLQCTGVAPLQTCTLSIQPLLELGRVAEIKTIEKRPSIRIHPCFEIATLERALELGDIAADNIGIQADGIHAREYVLVYRAADRVQQLFQRVPRVRLRRVGPEEKEQLIAAAALFTSRGEDCE
jgi:hypothetical protein